jgi:thiamine-phosphate pyrophosphorylase
MIAGELGADYVLFGEPDANGHRPSIDAVAERLDWWAELFEPPCIGYAASRDEAYEFARAGADFILVADTVWSDSRGPAAALADLGQAMREAHAASRSAAKAG